MSRMLRYSVRIGIDRTPQHDLSFGFRQLVDIVCKALSPGVNDPYTAIQAIDQLSVLYASLSTRLDGDRVARAADGTVVVAVPGRRYSEHLAFGCGAVRRYGAHEPTVCVAVLRMLGTCSELIGDDPERRTAIAHEAALLLAAAEREIAEPADLAHVRDAARIWSSDAIICGWLNASSWSTVCPERASPPSL